MSKRRDNVSLSDVANACEKLQADKERVSVRNVLAITGGSFATVSELIKQWQEQDALQSEVALPKDLVTAIKSSFKTMLKEHTTEYDLMLEREISRTHEALKQIVELESQNDKLENQTVGQKDDFESKVKAFDKKLTSAELRLDESVRREQALQKELDQVRQNLQDTQIKLAVAQTKVDEMSKLVELSNKKNK